MAFIETCHPTENDIQWIIQSMETSLVSPFQKLSVKQLFEIAPWTLICKYKNKNKAFAAFLDYPYNDHYSKEWYQSVKNVWEKSHFYGAQTIFLHFMVCESNVKDYLEEILRMTFRTIPSLTWCCILTEGTTMTNLEIGEFFRLEKSMESRQFQLWSTNRISYISKIGIRSKKSEDYLSLKNMFSQMYGPFKKDSLTKFTLDFLDYGEDKSSTLKYFTFDDDNTYIGVADNEMGEPVGFIYSTVQRVDLDMMNYCFQLETVYGLRKQHPEDKPENSFERESSSDSEESIDEEDELRGLIENIVDDVVLEHKINEYLNKVLNEVCEPTTKSGSRRCFKQQSEQDRKELMNSSNFSLTNPYHLSLTTKYANYFETDTLIRLINSADFDVRNEIHIQLVLNLGKGIQNIEENRIKEILNSKLFDPSVECFAAISVYVMRYMPEQKLELFKKSQIGYRIYEKLMYQKALAKKNDIPKAKKPALAPKLSFKDTQIILHYTKNIDRKKEPVKSTSTEKRVYADNMKQIHYRNMGFIAGLAMRGQYRIQGSFSIPKFKEPFGFEKGQDHQTVQSEEKEINLETFEKYPLPFIEKTQCLIQEIPHYNGGTNCLYVEQFAIEKDYDYQSLYLIMAAFEYFSRVDYCILLLPYGTHQVPYLRSHFYAVPARPFTAYERELFVFHKAAFNRSYEVRIYTKHDLKGIKRLIQTSCLKDYLLEDLEKGLKSKEKEIQTVVLLSENKIFGVAIVKELKEVEIIRRKYDIAERINMKYHKYKSQGQLLHCVIHPIFKNFSRIFLKEVMRLCQKSILYFKIYPTHLIPYDPLMWQSLCNALEHFIPLKLTTKASHKIKSYIVFNSKDLKENEDKEEHDKYYCLTYTCTKLILKDNNIVSSRIIIVGDSTVALGVLESLVYRHDCKYTNITVISKSGIREEFKLDERCYCFLPMDANYTTDELHSLCLPAWVTIIRADVISIKRNFIRLRELSTDKPYYFSVGFDYLIICDDLQFQALYIKKLDNCDSHLIKKQCYPLLKGLWQESYVIAKNASNVFSVNNAYEVAVVLNWLWRFFLAKVESRKQSKKKYKNLAEMERDKKDGRIVVYGNFLAAYTAIAALLEEEFPLCKITFIKPGNTQPTFHSEFLEEAIDYVIMKSGIETFKDATIEYDKEAEEIFTLDVTTEETTTRIDCSALLLFHDKQVNFNTFKTLHKSFLSLSFPVYNSKSHPYLLINTNFQTNVRNIFAVGTITEMHTDTRLSIRLEDCAFNKREMGMIVGENVHKAIINNLHLHNSIIPILTKPDIMHAKLPNKYFYTFITSPSSHFTTKTVPKQTKYRVESLVLGNLKTGAYIIPAPMTEEETNLLAEDVDSKEQLAYQEFLQEMRDFAQQEKEDLETNMRIERKMPDEPEYFALKFDDNETINTIECFTKLELDVAILKHLHGIHISQVFKIIQKGQSKTNEVLFRLAENWILPLDHVVFEEEDIKPRRRGYEGYWRPGYPNTIEEKLNGFLDSFASFKGNQK